MSNPDPSRRRGDSCPVCGRTADPAHTPFCSQGCRDRDLLQWLGDGYRLPGPAIDHGDEEGLDNSLPPPL